MDLSASFHCDLKGNFGSPNELVRAFIYNDYEIAPHTHDFYEMNIILSGTGTHIINGRAIAAKSGHVFVIPPGCVHSYMDTNNLSVYHILMQLDFIRRYEAENSQIEGFHLLMEIEPFLRSNSDVQMFLRLSPEQMLAIQPELRSIDEQESALYPNSFAYKNHSVLRLLYLLCHQLVQQLQKNEKRISNDKEYGIVRVLDYIHKNYGQLITIDQLCRQAYMSRSTFLRTFQTVCDCTPMQYVQMYRKQQALALLKDPSLKKTEIAHLCGFYDLSHMERVLGVKSTSLSTSSTVPELL